MGGVLASRFTNASTPGKFALDNDFDVKHSAGQGHGHHSDVTFLKNDAQPTITNNVQQDQINENRKPTPVGKSAPSQSSVNLNKRKHSELQENFTENSKEIFPASPKRSKILDLIPSLVDTYWKKHTLPPVKASDLDVPKTDLDGFLLSRKQHKRLRGELFWKLTADLRRQKRKEKRAQNRKAGSTIERVRHRAVPLSSDEARKLHIVIDLDFEQYMQDKDIRKLAKQCQTCYAYNRRRPHPVQLHFTSFNGTVLELLQEHNSTNWDVHTHTDHFLQTFNKSKIVYLTSESENVITDLDEDKVYIIGGLVDHNKHKGLTHSLAKQYKITHARLPIDEYVRMSSRRVLTVNHVFEIMHTFLEKKNWKEAFLNVIPQRKDVQPQLQHETGTY